LYHTLFLNLYLIVFNVPTNILLNHQYYLLFFDHIWIMFFNTARIVYLLAYVIITIVKNIKTQKLIHLVKLTYIEHYVSI